MVPAEILERREVLSGTPITLAQAQTDAAAAQTALNGAVSSYIASMVTLEGQLESETAAHQATFTGSATTAVGFFETAVDGINLNLKNALDPLSLGLSNDTQQIEDDLADDQQDAQDIFNTASATASGIFDAAVIGIDLGFQGDLDAADFDFNGTSTTENGTLDGVINTAEDDFDDAATQADSDFNDTVTDEQSDFDDAEQDNNDDYEDAIDDSPTGFGGIFNTTITGLESTRDGVLASHPNATWDPNVLDPTAVQGVQDGADAIFDSGLQGLIDTFETNVQTLQGTFNDASADAYEFFNDAIEIADQARTDAIADANSDFEDDMSGPRDTHATNMQTILGTFNDAITLATGVRDDARQAAQDAFDSVVDPAITTAEDAIADAQQDYYDWLSGTGANSISKVTWSRTKTVDTSVTPTSVTWSESGTTTSSNGDSSYWKGREQSWMPRLPQGAIAFGSPVVVVLGTVTATTEKFILPLTTTGPNGGAVGNVFDVALRARFDAYVDELDEIEDVYNDAVEQANLARDAAVLGANGTYLTSVYGNAAGLAPFTSGTPAEVFQTAQTAASTAFSQAEGGEFQDYSNAVSGYYMSLMQVIMDPSNMTMTMPDPAVIGGFGQTYLVNSLNAAIDYTQTVGAAWVTFVGAERAADSTRDSSIVLAEYNAARDTENAANTADLGAIDAWNGWAQDSLKIGADFTKEAASKAETRDNKIVTAIKTAVLVVNGQAQIQAKANVVADTTFADSQSGAWDDRIQDEATEDKILTKAAATAEETRTNAIATADGTHASSSADAGESLSNDLSQATVDLEGGLAGEENAMTSGALGLVTTWVSTVAAGIDGLYTANFPGDADQAAVSGAMADFTTDSAAAWATQASGEAGAWLTYTTETLADWQTMADNIADAETDRVSDLVDDYESLISSMAGGIHDFIDAMSDAAELWTQTVSGAAAAADVLLHAAGKTRADSTIDAAKTCADTQTNNEAGALTAYNGKLKTFITTATNAALPLEQSLVGAVAGILSSIRGLAHTQTLDDLSTIKTVFQSATTKDDGIFTAWANREVKQGVVMAAQQRDTFANTPTANLANNLPRTSTMSVPSMGTTGDSTFIPLRDGLVTQYLANPNQSAMPVWFGRVTPDGTVSGQINNTHPESLVAFQDRAPLPPSLPTPDSAGVGPRTSGRAEGIFRGGAPRSNLPPLLPPIPPQDPRSPDAILGIEPRRRRIAPPPTPTPRQPGLFDYINDPRLPILPERPLERYRRSRPRPSYMPNPDLT